MKFCQTLRHKILIAVGALLCMPVLYASANPLEGIPSGDYELDMSHASVLWKVSHLGFSTYIGRFTSFDADLKLNSEKFDDSKVAVEIKVDSLDTDYPFPEKEDFNKKLSGEWFKSSDHPTILFVSNEVGELAADNTFTMKGDLTLLGQTHPVSLQAKLNGAAAKHPFVNKAVVGFSATTEIDRTQWGLSNYTPHIGAEVAIEIEGEFIHKAE